MLLQYNLLKDKCKGQNEAELPILKEINFVSIELQFCTICTVFLFDLTCNAEELLANTQFIHQK